MRHRPWCFAYIRSGLIFRKVSMGEIIRVVMWADKTDILIFSFDCPHSMLLPDCESLSQAFASGACQSVSSVFQIQRGKPILELFCLATPGSSVALEMLSGELSETWTGRSIAGSVVEHSLPTRESQPRFPANAQCFSLFFPPRLFMLPPCLRGAQSSPKIPWFWPPGVGKWELKSSRQFWAEDSKELS